MKYLILNNSNVIVKVLDYGTVFTLDEKSLTTLTYVDPNIKSTSHHIIEYAGLLPINFSIYAFKFDNDSIVLHDSNYIQSLSRPSLLTVEEIRNQRNLLLEKSDWTQLTDAPVDSIAWANYRQALRDLPEQAGFPFTIIWPQQPQ